MSKPTHRYTGQLAQAELGLDYYVARFYDPLTGHFTQADTLIPEPGKASAFDRYTYVLNNPMRFSDPSGHGIDCGIGDPDCDRSGDLKRWREYTLKKNESEKRKRDTHNSYSDLYKWENNLYINGWNNFNSAWTIFWSPNSSWLQKDGAAIYMEFWISAHVALGAGMGGLACAAIGPACVGVVEGALGICTAGFGSLSQAGNYFVRSYNELRAMTENTSLQVHHIIEQRFFSAGSL